MRFGVHVSIAGGLWKGLLRAVELGCDTAQLFLVNPRGWRAKPLADDEIERFLEVRNNEAKQIHPLVAHMPYLPNLAAADRSILQKSIESLCDNLERCDALGIDFLVLHMGKGDPATAAGRMIENIKRAFNGKTYSTTLLLENTAGQGRELGSQMADIIDIYDKLPNNVKKGICLDTCHLFAAGYDVRNKNKILKLIRVFEQRIGFSEVKLLHVNDSLKPLGSRVDRHAIIGEGFIGKEGFKTLFSTRRIRSLPCILEVPRTDDKDDIYQLKLVRKLANRRHK